MANADRPVARTRDIHVEELGEELVLYDELRNVGCSLNRTAGIVWRNANGNRTIQDLVDVLREQVGESADADLVLVGLDRLEEHGLLESGYAAREPAAARFSRRRFIQAAGVAGTAALGLLPVVRSVVAPTPAAAASK